MERNPIIEEQRKWIPVLWILFASSLVFSIYNSFLLQSLWLDETVSYWVSTAPSLTETISRAWNFQGQSPLYFVLLRYWINAFGESELSMRIPSILALGLSSLILYRLALQFCSQSAAILTTGLFCCSTFVQQTLSARPYACGILCVLWSASLLLRVRDGNGKHDLVWYGISTTLIGYFHILFSAMLGCELAYLLTLHGKIGSDRWRAIFKVWCIAALLQAIPVWQALALQSQGIERSFARSITMVEALSAIVPYNLMLAGGTALLISCILAIYYRRIPTASSLQENLLFLTWAFLAPVLFFSLSYALSVPWFIPRYFVWHVPGLALLIGTLVSRLAPRRLVAFVSLIGLGILLHGEINRNWGWEQWRDVIKSINAVTVDSKDPVLISTGLVESKSIKWLENSSKQGFLLAPLSKYALANSIALAVPPNYDEKYEQYFIKNIIPTLHGSAFYLVAMNWRPGGSDTPSQYARYFRRYDYEAFLVGRFDPLWVLKFQKKPS